MAKKKQACEAVQCVENFVTLPSKVEVNGYDVSVRPMVGMEESALQAYGMYQGGEIIVSANTSPQHMAMTLVHEILHACFDHSGLRCKYFNVNGVDVEEEIVSQLGFSLGRLIGTNKEFVEFVQGAFANKEIRFPEFDDVQTNGRFMAKSKKTENSQRVFLK